MKAGRLVAWKQHERLRREALERNPAQRRELVGAGQRGDRALLQHDHRVELRNVLDRRANEPDVDHSGAHQAQLLRGRALVQLDLDVGSRRAESLHDPGHDREQRRADEVDAQVAGLAGVDPARGGDRAVELAQQLTGVAQERLPGGRELHPAAGPRQQLAAELFLQRADLLAEWRLGDVQPRGGAAEVQLLRDRDEISQLAQFHGDTL